jgi:hypothetical protein
MEVAMPYQSHVEARTAAVCFSALGAAILSAWIVGSFAPEHAQAAAFVGLAFPLAAAAMARLRNRGGDPVPVPVRSQR